MQLFYSPQIKDTDTTFTFDRDESKHIIKVLRKRSGDDLWVTNGKGILVQGKITDESPKSCSVQIVSVTKKHPDNHHLHMAVAPTKSNDRFEWFLEKATEIGIHEITPIICERSERKTIKLERMERIVQSAMKQSFQTFLPKVNKAITLKDFLQNQDQGLFFMAHCDSSQRFELKKSILPNKPITILIGPEGDFSEKEIKAGHQTGYIPVSMGDNRLRTETAAIVACHTVALINTI
ncbi:16S rRNA (uracil(1498)-N(3))-methyltransferase [Maribacter sp. 2304DJ31-5]|uniref:16S rRNA (uracil(1498)-N(3))-methyltransferase n=1 Tax=Maribacter sp. 2304DJ31-5 TaxID=3386273 RepID=UPI0039BC5E70